MSDMLENSLKFFNVLWGHMGIILFIEIVSFFYEIWMFKKLTDGMFSLISVFQAVKNIKYKGMATDG